MLRLDLSGVNRPILPYGIHPAPSLFPLTVSASPADIINIYQSKAALVRGLLDFLTYRALRVSGRLSPEKTREELSATLQQLIPTKRTRKHDHQ
jgi:hypothetical protein